MYYLPLSRSQRVYIMNQLVNFNMHLLEPAMLRLLGYSELCRNLQTDEEDTCKQSRFGGTREMIVKRFRRNRHALGL